MSCPARTMACPARWFFRRYARDKVVRCALRVQMSSFLRMSGSKSV